MALKKTSAARCPTSQSSSTRASVRCANVSEGQGDFRAEDMQAYNETCAVTGTNIVEALEAAHIVAYRGRDHHHISNGLALRADIHALFDRGLMAIHEDTYGSRPGPRTRRPRGLRRPGGAANLRSGAPRRASRSAVPAGPSHRLRLPRPRRHRHLIGLHHCESAQVLGRYFAGSGSRARAS